MPGRCKRMMGSAGAAGAMAIILLIAACDDGASRAEAQKYENFIREKHELLGRAIILQGRLIESFNVNDNILEDVDFMDAEGYLEDILEKIGPAEDIEAMTLPTANQELHKLHRQLADAVYYLRACNRSLEDSAYTSTGFAEAAWDKARVAFGDFTRELVLRTTGEELPDLQPRETPEYAVGDVLNAQEGGNLGFRKPSR